jgi:hypothetical protein
MVFFESPILNNFYYFYFYVAPEEKFTKFAMLDVLKMISCTYCIIMRAHTTNEPQYMYRPKQEKCIHMNYSLVHVWKYSTSILRVQGAIYL